MMRQVLIQLGEDDMYVAECLSLPGCIHQGRTIDAAVSNGSKYEEIVLSDWGKGPIFDK